MPMTKPPPHPGQPQLLFNWGEVTICALPLVSHCVVFGATVVHSGAAAAIGVIESAPATPAAAKSGVSARILVRMVGLLDGPEKLELATAPAATNDQRRTIELVFPRIHIRRFRRGGVDLNVAGCGAFGRRAAEGLGATGIGARRQCGRVAGLSDGGGR